MRITPELKNLRNSFTTRGFDIRFTGGCVRDHLFGIEPNDYDFATNATPEEQQEIYEADGIECVDTGLKHGTWTVVLSPQQVHEITSLRTETGHDGRHASVSWTRDWLIDLARRDLTINAMAMTFEGELIDPFDGQRDLKNRYVRFVGNPTDRMREDYLRILRFFRFQGRFGTMQYDAAALKAVVECAPGLAGISKERVWSEIAKIVSVSPHMLMDMIELVGADIPKHIGLPVKINHSGKPGSIIEMILAQQHTKDPASLMAAYLDDEDSVRALATDWKWSARDRDQALFIVKDTDFTILASKLKVAVQGHPKYLVAESLRVHRKESLAKAIENWKVPLFPVPTQDLLDRGLMPGPNIGQTLRRLKSLWGDSNFKLDRTALLEAL
jgi:tRNA nucleotidyltransferase (CCA-adding enzyme)